MSKLHVEPVFVDRKTAAARLMISVFTFDAWLRAGFIPPPQIDRGQIVRWHWPSLEEKLAGLNQEPALPDPFLEGLANIQSGRRSREVALTGDAAEMARRYSAAQAQLRANLPSTPLSKRERYCLTQLAGLAAGDLIDLDAIRGVSLGTAEHLEIRGFLSTVSGSSVRWRITSSGVKAAEDMIAAQTHLDRS